MQDPELDLLEEFDGIGEDIDGELADLIPEPIIPYIDLDDSDLENPNSLIDYSERGPCDVILSGPISGGWGPGRFHPSRKKAYIYCAAKYTPARVVPVQEVKGRWAFLIKELKNAI